MQLFFAFILTLAILITCSSLLFFSRKNIRSRCSTPEGCSGCKKKCRKKDYEDVK